MRKDVYSRHIKNYQTHWWFKARRNIIQEILKISIKKKKYEILDFGAGSGTNINMLANFGFVYLYEKDKKTQKYLIKKFKNKKKFKIINKNYLNKKKFDIIVAADVLEHIKNDKKIIKQFHKRLKNSGFLVLTVPAFNFLYSKKDITLKHYRRYSLTEIKKLIPDELKIKTVALCGGSGKSFIHDVVQKEVDLYITGELGYHDMQYLRQQRVGVILLGHYQSESFVLDVIRQRLDHLDLEIDIVK